MENSKHGIYGILYILFLGQKENFCKPFGMWQVKIIFGMHEINTPCKQDLISDCLQMREIFQII